MIQCYVLVPLTYNDGTRVEPNVMEKIKDELYVHFGGFTPEGKRRGTYRRQDDGSKQVEVTMKYGIAVDGEEGVSELREIVKRIGILLGQESVYLEIARGTEVEFVKAERKGGA